MTKIVFSFYEAIFIHYPFFLSWILFLAWADRFGLDHG